MLYTKFECHRTADVGEYFYSVYTMYGHVGNLGHMTRIIWTNFRFAIPLRLHMKFGFDWPSGFWDKAVRRVWTMDGRTTAIGRMDNIACQYYKFTHESKGSGELKILFLIIEPHHDKTNKMACAPSEDSDQPGHPPSLIRVFAVRMKKAWVISYPLSAQRKLWSDWADETLIRLGRCPGWSESLLGIQLFCWFCHEVAHIRFLID